ncbi:hypothetical protein N7509_009574 [Penicillium cosmopolitanum]|uniref:Protein-S-isoprenylcysteine O-methyltransferase n=1 Tax=Penicillium cosmopolitanum TaxID=1131564 RepID=A0A9X0B3R2_9EURO|nr:uncharacterized protein N7509_009574 [Penicillium cosmopolitanum]KAJ5387033.1 hypothetical protein N7509_009574 [Penicillium cosmopolitanum]
MSAQTTSAQTEAPAPSSYTTWQPRRPRTSSTASASYSDNSESGFFPNHSPNNTSTATTTPLDPSSIYPNGRKSLSGISLRAFALGTSLGLSTSLTIYLAFAPGTSTSPTWRLPFFITTLSLFHFLEFFITAHYNTTTATVSSFLLTSNGWAYNAAHGSALLECALSLWLWPNSPTRSSPAGPVCVVLGFILVILGQIIRSLAMAHAAANFNHHVQSRHKDGHVLVTSGVYAVLRHPSYFGFFWWGLGTQLVLGNVVCFVLYGVVLWRFFASRIRTEESFLINFFADDYVQYKKNTRVGIPGIA